MRRGYRSVLGSDVHRDEETLRLAVKTGTLFRVFCGQSIEDAAKAAVDEVMAMEARYRPFIPWALRLRLHWLTYRRDYLSAALVVVLIYLISKV